MPLDSEIVTTPSVDEAPSLRDTLRDNLAAAVADGAVETREVKPDAESSDGEALASAAQRARDEQGRFARQEQEGKEAAPVKEPVKDAASPVPEQAPVIDPNAAPAIQPPSSWKPTAKAEFLKASPVIQQEVLRREGDFLRGLAPYKAEIERVKPITDAMAPVTGVLEQHGLKPEQWIGNMAQWHQRLALGNDHEKVNAALQIIRDFNIPLMDYIQQGGALPQFNPNAPRPQAQQTQPQDINRLVEQQVSAQMEMRSLTDQVRTFKEAKDAQGNPLHPHYEALEGDMIALIESRMASDLNGAYTKALRLHDDLFQQDLAAKQQSDAKAQAAAKQAQADRAKRRHVSVNSTTPGAVMQSAGDKGLKEMLAENLRAAAGGRL